MKLAKQSTNKDSSKQHVPDGRAWHMSRPGSLQQQHGVVALVGAGRGDQAVRERQVGGLHVPVAAARQPAALHQRGRVARAHRLQAAC